MDLVGFEPTCPSRLATGNGEPLFVRPILGRVGICTQFNLSCRSYSLAVKSHYAYYAPTELRCLSAHNVSSGLPEALPVTPDLGNSSR